MDGKRYRLARGTQVRKEDFGLLFYTMAGPRLYFLSSGSLLGEDFFQGEKSPQDFWDDARDKETVDSSRMRRLEDRLRHLVEKGVIVEC